MSVDLKALRALAEAATPGRWEQSHTTFVVSHDGPLGGMTTIGLGFKGSDAAFIAAANPTAVIELLDEVERARFDAAQLDAHLSAATQEVERLTKGQEGLAAAWTAALADNDEAREQLRKAEAMKECDCQGVGHAPWCRIASASFKHKTEGDLARAALETTKREYEKAQQQLSSQTRLAASLADEVERSRAECDYLRRSHVRVNEANASLAEQLDEMRADRDEWRQQHDNAVASWRTDVTNLAKRLDECRDVSGVKDWAADVKMAARWAQHAARVDAINLDLAADALDAKQQVETIREQLEEMRKALNEACDLADNACDCQFNCPCREAQNARIAALRSVGTPRGES